MKSIIKNDSDKCLGCNRCIRVCPIEDANIAQEIDITSSTRKIIEHN